MLALLNTVKLVVLRMKENSFHLTYFLSPSLVPFSLNLRRPSSSELPSLLIPTVLIYNVILLRINNMTRERYVHPWPRIRTTSYFYHAFLFNLVGIKIESWRASVLCKGGGFYYAESSTTMGANFISCYCPRRQNYSFSRAHRIVGGILQHAGLTVKHLSINTLFQATVIENASK